MEQDLLREDDNIIIWNTKFCTEDQACKAVQYEIYIRKTKLSTNVHEDDILNDYAILWGRVYRSLVVWDVDVRDEWAMPDFKHIFNTRFDQDIHGNIIVKYKPLRDFIQNIFFPKAIEEEEIIQKLLVLCDKTIPGTITQEYDTTMNIPENGSNILRSLIRLAYIWSRKYDTSRRCGSGLYLKSSTNSNAQKMSSSIHIFDQFISPIDIEYIEGGCNPDTLLVRYIKKEWAQLYHIVLTKLGMTTESAIRFFRTIYTAMTGTRNGYDIFNRDIVESMGNIRLWTYVDSSRYVPEDMYKLDKWSLHRILFGYVTDNIIEKERPKKENMPEINYLFDLAHLTGFIDIERGSYFNMDIMLKTFPSNYTKDDNNMYRDTRGYGSHRGLITIGPVKCDMTQFKDIIFRKDIHPEFSTAIHSNSIVYFLPEIDSPFLYSEMRRRYTRSGSWTEEYDFTRKVIAPILIHSTSNIRSFPYLPGQDKREISEQNELKHALRNGMLTEYDRHLGILLQEKKWGEIETDQSVDIMDKLFFSVTLDENTTINKIIKLSCVYPWDIFMLKIFTHILICGNIAFFDRGYVIDYGLDNNFTTYPSVLDINKKIQRMEDFDMTSIEFTTSPLEKVISILLIYMRRGDNKLNGGTFETMIEKYMTDADTIYKNNYTSLNSIIPNFSPDIISKYTLISGLHTLIFRTHPIRLREQMSYIFNDIYLPTSSCTGNQFISFLRGGNI